ncbi:aspartyl-phosphate phosphatase Spo0E family protein [Sporolactobacillus sp. THM7-4]|nr:aspartyl-phosphate phosphatase Spo0E family protein [Sporolactobacillus sp. THM7-4]
MNKRQISIEIEKLRNQLLLAALNQSLTSQKVQLLSRRLDQWIIKYERMIR